jgi:ATP-binding cassette, subfamily B, multidrug efflux pump
MMADTDQQDTQPKASNERPAGPPRGRGPMGGMGMPAAKSLNFGPSAMRLLRRLRPERIKIAVVVLLGAISVAFSVLGPKLLGDGTNIVVAGWISARLPSGLTKAQAIAELRAHGQGTTANLLSGLDFTPGQGIDFTALGQVLLVVLALYVVSAMFSFVQSYLLNGVVQRTMYRLREDVEDKINRLPLGYVDRMQRGELLSRVTNDIDNISESMQQTLSQVVSSVLTVIGILVMMFVTSWSLALVSLITIPLTLIITTFIAKRSQKQFVAQWAATGALNAHIEENFTGHALVKVFGRQHEAEADFAAKNEALFQAGFRAQAISGTIQPSMTFVGNLVYVLIAVVGGLQVTTGALTLGAVQAFIQYSRQFTQPIAQLGSMANLLQSGVASAERVFELLDTTDQTPDPSPATSPRRGAGHLAFEHVSFAYVPDRPLIQDVSFEASPGQTVAIVGPTGAGKTTLVNLLMRFYDIDAGRITLDGVDIASMTRADLRSRTGMVLQDTWLFGGTIRDNIAYARPDASEDEILSAADAAYVDRFVHSLPDGYDTVLDDDASNISAGEKQLLTIARAFLARPDILILDEATSSVDTRTEVLVQHAMNALRADRTSFVIAHRLSTIRDADLILVMRDGSIVEQGTHASLVEQGGVYADLYEAQFAAAIED